jgi:hypothetical protein
MGSPTSYVSQRDAMNARMATEAPSVDGAVRYANVHDNWTERAEPADVLAVLRSDGR